MYITRTIEKTIHKVSSFFPVLFVTGPRQAGKTTMLQACARADRSYVSLDSLENRKLAQSDPALFLQRFKTPLLIDEIHYAPQLFPYIKELADRHQRAGMFWLAGSQHFLLMKNVTESLAGRAGILDLDGLSQAERDGNPERQPFLPEPDVLAQRAAGAPRTERMSVFHRIWKGSCPEMHDAFDSMWSGFYASYVKACIERDIRDLGGVGNELLFLDFMKMLAARTGQILNCSDIARHLGVSAPTVKSWTTLLRAAKLIFMLQPYYSNINSRILKTPKVYFMDTGLACFLAGCSTPQLLENSYLSGAMLETFAVSEIIKSWRHNGKQANIYYYRDKDKREIDVVIEENLQLYPIAIRKKSSPDARDIKNFKVVEKVLGKKRGHGAVLCLAETCLPIAQDADAVPISCI